VLSPEHIAAMKAGRDRKRAAANAALAAAEAATAVVAPPVVAVVAVAAPPPSSNESLHTTTIYNFRIERHDHEWEENDGWMQSNTLFTSRYALNNYLSSILDGRGGNTYETDIAGYVEEAAGKHPTAAALVVERKAFLERLNALKNYERWELTKELVISVFPATLIH